MNERDIPSVPITTLAGVASLTDLLPVLPLPTPLPSTLSNKSQLFHPRVAEEAAILLATRDDNLVSLLIQSLMQTSADHIELKDGTPSPDPNQSQRQNTPELLKAIIETNPNVFDGVHSNRWNSHNCTPKYNGLSPSIENYQHYSPHNSIQDSPSTQQSFLPQHVHQQSNVIPSQSSPHVNMGSPPSQTRPTNISISTAQNHLSPQWNLPVQNPLSSTPQPPAQMANRATVITEQKATMPISQNGVFFDGLLPISSYNNQGGDHNMQHIMDQSDPLSLSPQIDHSNQRHHVQNQLFHLQGQSPIQATTAPSPLRQELQVPLSGLRDDTVTYNSVLQNISESDASKSESLESNRCNTVSDIRLPFIKLDRLNLEDSIIRKRKSIALENSNNIRKSTGESDSDDNTPLKPKSEKNTSDKFQTEIELARERSWQAVKRKHEEANKAEVESAAIVKPKLRKVERRLVPVIEMLSVDELMETNTYQRFNKLMDAVFDIIDDDIIIINDDVDGMGVPEEWLLPRYQIQELCAEAAKLKTLGAMEAIPADRLVKLLSILEKNIRAGERISPLGDPDDSEDVRMMWMETTMERVMGASDSGLTALYIMTSPNMPKRVYLEDVIDRIIMFTKFQLLNTIYCTYDPVYTIQSTSKKKGEKQKRRGHSSWSASGRGSSRTNNVRELYARSHETVALLGELLASHTLTDTTVLHASTVAVTPFFVENVSELQLSALKLVTTIFTKYEQHRRLLLEDILASIARIPSTKHNLRSYRLSSDEHIQMLTALVLQLVQCVVRLPDSISNSGPGRWTDTANTDEEKIPLKMSQVDKDGYVISKYDSAVSIGGTFLTSFLNKCRSRNEEVDFRPLFENFVHDLLTTVNKPEWPATELLLSLLGTMLVKYVSDKSMEMSVRVASLDYLGLVAARLRKDTVQSRGKLATMDLIIKDIKTEEEKDGVIGMPIPECIDVDEERTLFLQRVLLDYLAVNGQKDEAWSCARHFYITQWYRDAISQLKTPTPPRRTPHKNKKKYRAESSDEDSILEDEDMDRLPKLANNKNDMSNMEKLKSVDKRKYFFLDKIRPFRYQGGSQVQVMQSYIDYSGAELIAQYLASKRSFSQSFDKYLQKILLILCENTIAIRTKAMKCLALIVEADPAVLARGDMQAGVHRSFLDQSTSVREAAVDLVGKFVLSRPDLIDKYYAMLSSRILDTGVSVRKRVIKILKDICIECPEFPKIPEICVKMIRRVNDEEGIRKLVMEVFQNMWFSPCPVHRHAPAVLDPSADPLTRKVLNITDVVLSSRDIGLEWFQQLLQSLFKPREDKEDSTKIHFTPPKSLLLACQQIVDCLMENLLRIEENSVDGQGTSQRLVACLSTIHLFAKIRPQLLVSHAHTLQPYLSLKCQTASDQQIISCVASTLELVVPLMEHPSETFLAQLEEDSVKLILQHGQVVIASCLSCLGSIVNNVTKNFKLIRDVFHQYHGVLLQWRQGWQISPDRMRIFHRRPQFRRALFIVGLLLRHFDFTDALVISGLPLDIKDQVFTTLMFFLQLDDEDFQSHTLKAIGSVCVRHYEFMLQPELKEFYHYLLTSDLANLEMKADVLRNIEMYLLEEEHRMIKQDKEWAKRSKMENLKEMGDVSSGMASTVIQLYLKEILGAFLHTSTVVRTSTMKVVQLVLAQGLVHPVQIVPYLICMSTDTEVTVSHTADKQLQEIDKKYPGFIHMKSQLGVKLSYELQKILQTRSKDGIFRGFRLKEQDEYPTALNGFLYSLLRGTRPQRRALALSILKQFDDHWKSTLEQLLYLADNLAYFPYQVQDEPLFIIHHIDIIISTSGSNLLQLFREGLIPRPSANEVNPITGVACLAIVDGDLDDDEDEDASSILSRFPEDTTQLRSCMGAAQGCLLLLVLKLHLKQTYGITDAKISQYSPSESAKVYEKAINRRSAPKFSPKVTICKIKEPDSGEELDEKGRISLINDYLEFKQLMLKFDPEEEEEEDVPAVNSALPAGDGDVPMTCPPAERSIIVAHPT